MTEDTIPPPKLREKPKWCRMDRFRAYCSPKKERSACGNCDYKQKTRYELMQEKHD